MTRLGEHVTCPLPDQWTPEQALAVHDALEVLTNALWARYGAQLQSLLLAEEWGTLTMPQLDLFDPNDPISF